MSKNLLFVDINGGFRFGSGGVANACVYHTRGFMDAFLRTFIMGFLKSFNLLLLFFIFFKCFVGYTEANMPTK